MTRRVTRNVACVVFALSRALPAVAEAPTSAADPYYHQGLALLEADTPDYEEAYRALKRAYEQSRDWRVLASLAHTAEALERDGEAIQAYAEYLARGGDAIEPDERSAAERALRVLQSNAGRITVTSSVPDLTVVASRVGSEAPPQVYRLEGGRIELELRSGTHLLTATAGGDRLEWQVALTPGSAVEHRFEFSGSRTLSAGSLDSEATAPGGASPLRVASIAAASVGSAALVAGAVTGLLVLAREDDARALCRKGQRGGTECPERARDDFEAARNYATTTNVLLIGGGLLAALGVGTFVFSGASGSDQRRALRVAPRVSSREATVSVAGAF